MSALRGRRARLGAGALLSVLLLVAAAGGVLGVYYADRADAEARAVDREAGRVFALWFEATHRASMETDFRPRLAGGGFVLTLAELRGLGVVPPGLPETAGRGAPFAVGIVDDGSGVPMAFGVVEPQGWANTASLREGALEGGLAQIEDVAGSGSEMHVHVAALVAALGRAAESDALFVTADRGVRYREGVVYRRAQPGQRRLNRMETALDAGGEDVLGAGAVAAESVSVTSDGTVGGAGTVATRTESASLEAAELGAVEVSAPGLTVTRKLVVGSSVSGGVSTVAMDVTGHAQAGAVDAAVMTAQDATIVTTTVVTRVSTVGTLSGSRLVVASGIGTDRAGFLGLYGPSGTVSGGLRVGSCAGC